MRALLPYLGSGFGLCGLSVVFAFHGHTELAIGYAGAVCVLLYLAWESRS